MSRLTGRLRHRLWLAGFGALSWLAARRRPRATHADVRALDFDGNTRRMGVTMTDLLRDRMRRRWLRLVRMRRDEHE